MLSIKSSLCELYMTVNAESQEGLTDDDTVLDRHLKHEKNKD